MKKIIVFVFILSFVFPTLSFAAPYFTTSIRPATKYTGSTWTPLKPVSYNFTNPHATLGSQFNPIHTRTYGTSGFINPYAKKGSQFNPVFTRTLGSYGFTNTYAPLGSQFNPINFR